MPKISTAFCIGVVLTAGWLAEAQSPPLPARNSESGNALRAAEFDANNDGYLNASERATARDVLKQEMADRPQRRRRGGRGGGRGDDETSPPKPGVKLSPDQVQLFPGLDLYDLDTFRTIFIDFASDDWESELADFYRTDITVPAKMTIDGQKYTDVGVGFRGNSSFFTVSAGRKRSLSITVNARNPNQRVQGFRSMNLLNAHADPSFLRETLFSHIASQYIPTYQVNLVRVVINGESWGVYVSAQQFNGDFTKEFFESREGVRWKFPPGRGGSAGTLVYAGDDKAAYKATHLKTPEVEDAWPNLIELCQRLETTPTEDLDTQLDDILNVDRALWFLALDNLFIDGDGYLSRASDYIIYQDPNRRFHTLHYDSNETFRNAGGGGPGIRLPTESGNGAFLDPFIFATEDSRDLADRPLARLLDNPRLRMRYAAHVRSIKDDWISWNRMSPLVEKLTKMIDADVQADTRKLYSYEQFADGGGGERGIPRLQDFVQARETYLEKHSELVKLAPAIIDVRPSAFESGVIANMPLTVRARVASAPSASEVLLYLSTTEIGPFEAMEMKPANTQTEKETKVFEAQIPPQSAGTRVRYYVEARGTEATAFYPRNTEVGAITYRVRPPKASETIVVINEVLSSNKYSAKDPQGEAEDYIELKNTTGERLDVSGMYLSDDLDRILKWEIPPGTFIPAYGYLLVWADGDVEATPGLHANFKLSKAGETIILIDRDDRNNQLLDQVEYENLRADVAYARMPDGKGRFQVLPATPGKSN